MGVVIMQGVPKIFGALRGHLCDSIAFLLSLELRPRTSEAVSSANGRSDNQIFRNKAATCNI